MKKEYWQGMKTVVFDCDGVILNSNKVKTQAFYNATLPYGGQAAQAMVKYHVENGGISRYEKFAYFLSEIIGKDQQPDELERLLDSYAQEVVSALLTCEVAEGLEELRQILPDSRWLIVSGGDQQELREVFAKRNLSQLFDGGIFGSPADKDAILAREIENGNIALPAVFIGDSRYDYQAAAKAGLEFIFVSAWTEFRDWENYFAGKDIVYYSNVSEIYKAISL